MRRRHAPEPGVGRTLLLLPIGLASVITALVLSECGPVSGPRDNMAAAPLAAAAGDRGRGSPTVDDPALDVDSPFLLFEPFGDVRQDDDQPPLAEVPRAGVPPGEGPPDAAALEGPIEEPIDGLPPDAPPAAATDGAAAHPGAVGSAAGQPGGQERLVFADGFDGNDLNGQSWWVYDNPANGRSADRVRVSGGTLTVSGGTDGSGRQVTGGIASRLDQRFGRWEARLRMDRGAGYYLAMTIWPRDESPRTAGAILFGSGTSSRGQAVASVTGRSGENRLPRSIDMTTWRTVSIEWLSDRVTFRVDGSLVHEVRGAQVPSAAAMHLAFSVEPSCPAGCAATGPVSLHVDSVRIYGPPALP